MLSKDGEIRRDESCIDYAGKDVSWLKLEYGIRFKIPVRGGKFKLLNLCR